MNEPLRKSVRIPCPLEHAFEVFTGRIDLWWPESHRRFDRSELVLPSEPGGRFVERSATGEEARLGEVFLCEPPHRIAYTWYPGGGTGPTEVDVRFSSDGDHTVVEVTHSEGPSGLGDTWPERAAIFLKNWDFVLERYVRHVRAH